MARRCRICDSQYDITHSFIGRLDPNEDTCPTCEEIIVEAIEDMEAEDAEEEEEDNCSC